MDLTIHNNWYVCTVYASGSSTTVLIAACGFQVPFVQPRAVFE